jgi:Uma2 family endonuclease
MTSPLSRPAALGPWTVQDLQELPDDSYRYDVLVAIEVISPKNAGHDLILKRHEYGAAGIAQYWVADGRTESLSILGLGAEPGQYVELAEAKPGTPWRSDYPFPLVVDPAEIF